MIQDSAKIPKAIAEELNQRFPRWALYKRTGVAYYSKMPPVFYEVWQRGETLSQVAEFEIHQLPGCAGACVSTHSKVMPEWQKQGIGSLLNQLRIELARELGYGMMLCTFVDTNVPERCILNTNRWSHLLKFLNPRTKHTVVLSEIHL